VQPNLLGKNRVSIPLVHVGGALPDVTATLRILQGNILNVKWSWTDASANKRMFEVPDEYITTEKMPLQVGGDLSQLVKVSVDPFQVQFLFDDASQSQYFQLDGMVYDNYLNWIKTRAFTEQGDKFKGIFGIGERANFDFFYKDGVYSLWTRDVTTPIDYGNLPGSNMYGTHPCYMYKHNPNQWVGVLHKLAAAQDWWIKNDQVNG
jgi:hypothetical protein